MMRNRWPSRVTSNCPYEAYDTKAHSGSSSLWRLPTAGGEPERVLDGLVSRAFQVFDGGIYYVDRSDDTSPIVQPPSRITVPTTVSSSAPLTRGARRDRRGWRTGSDRATGSRTRCIR